jgi:hypothetical protein
MTLNSGEELPIPLSYVWARIFVRTVSLIGGGQCRFSEKPINWYHIMTKDENSLELHEVQRSTGPANQKLEPHRYKKLSTLLSWEVIRLIMCFENDLKF